jgi:hypothetical protein
MYPRLVRHAITTYGAADVVRFLGHKLTADQPVSSRFSGEQLSSVKCREEGVRIKHWLNQNSLKLHDKGSVLRAEYTINDPTDPARAGRGRAQAGRLVPGVLRAFRVLPGFKTG